MVKIRNPDGPIPAFVLFENTFSRGGGSIWWWGKLDGRLLPQPACEFHCILSSPIVLKVVCLLVCSFLVFVSLNPVRYFWSTLFSPYGLHFLQHTVRDNIPLSPTRGGGCSPSPSTPRPPTTACARRSDHSLTISNLPLPPTPYVMSTFECPKVLNPVQMLGTCTV